MLGRSGEAPAAPKTLSVWLNHVSFNPSHQLRFRVQTGPGGVVRLGQLSGIRQIRAQIEAGVSHVQRQGLADAGAQQGLAAPAAAGAGFGGDGDGKGPMRKWQVASASWWQGGLLHEVGVRLFEVELLCGCLVCFASFVCYALKESKTIRFC
jgi:hypothetical protein